MFSRVIVRVVILPVCAGCGGEGASRPNAESDTVPCLPPQTDSFTNFALGSNYSDDSSITSIAYAYPSDLTTAFGSVLSVSGIVNTYAGVGVSFGACVDASEFSGIEFDIWGDAGPTGVLTAYVGTRENRPEPPFTATGTCKPPDPSQPFRSCLDAYTTFGVPPTTERTSIPFSSFGGGEPHPGANSSELLSFFLAFDWNFDQAEYPINLSVGNMSFSR